MGKLSELSQEELGKYLVENGDKFTVIRVRSNLQSLVLGDFFELVFKKAIQRVFEGDVPPLNIQDAAGAVYTAGLDLEKHVRTGLYGFKSQHSIEMPLAVWMRFLAEVISPLFGGEITWLIRHNETNEQITTTNNSSHLEKQREHFGLNPDRAYVDELIRVFEIS